MNELEMKYYDGRKFTISQVCVRKKEEKKHHRKYTHNTEQQRQR